MRVRLPDTGSTSGTTYIVPCGLHGHYLRGASGQIQVGAGFSQNAHIRIRDQSLVSIWQCVGSVFHGVGTLTRNVFGGFGYESSVAGASSQIGMDPVQVYEGDSIDFILTPDPGAEWRNIVIDFTDYADV